MIVLTIPEPVPSVNLLHGHHWTRKKKLRDRWGWLVRAALLDAKVHVRPKLERANVTIERYGARILDADNFRAGAKQLQDALVAEGLIRDDSLAVIGEPTLRQFKGKERKTIVRIEAI